MEVVAIKGCILGSGRRRSCGREVKLVDLAASRGSCDANLIVVATTPPKNHQRDVVVPPKTCLTIFVADRDDMPLPKTRRCRHKIHHTTAAITLDANISQRAYEYSHCARAETIDYRSPCHGIIGWLRLGTQQPR